MEAGTIGHGAFLWNAWKMKLWIQCQVPTHQIPFHALLLPGPSCIFQLLPSFFLLNSKLFISSHNSSALNLLWRTLRLGLNEKIPSLSAISEMCDLMRLKQDVDQNAFWENMFSKVICNKRLISKISKNSYNSIKNSLIEKWIEGMKRRHTNGQQSWKDSQHH